jgi:hypothetical protein
MGHDTIRSSATTWAAVAVLGATCWAVAAQHGREGGDVNALLQRESAMHQDVQAAWAERARTMEGTDAEADAVAVERVRSVVGEMMRVEQQIAERLR